MIECKYCNIQLENHNSAGAHARWCVKNPNRKINKELLPKKCIMCGNNFVGKRRKTCGVECATTVSPATKKLLSAKRTKFLAENPNEHPWKKENKHVSIPCENVKEYLKNKNIQYVPEFPPLLDRGFSIDIAFPHIMVGIEINGNQHYDAEGKLKPYYSNRHNLIEQAGWKLIEVHYSQCFNEKSIEQFLNFDIPFDNGKVIESYFEEKRIREINKKNTLPRGVKIKQKTFKKWESVKNDIFNHGIDFSKFGWVNKVAMILCISPSKINNWMKRYHPEFFEKECFKRKIHVKSNS